MFRLLSFLVVLLASGGSGLAQNDPHQLAPDYFTKGRGIVSTKELGEILESPVWSKPQIAILKKTIEESRREQIQSLDKNVQRALAKFPRNNMAELLVGLKNSLLEQRPKILQALIRHIDEGTVDQRYCGLITESLMDHDQDEVHPFLLRVGKMRTFSGTDWKATCFTLILFSCKNVLTAKNLETEYTDAHAFLLEGAADKDSYCEGVLVSLGTKEGGRILQESFLEARSAITVTELDAMPRFLILLSESQSPKPEYLKGIEEIGQHAREVHHPQIRKFFFNNLSTLGRAYLRRKDMSSYEKIASYLDGESVSPDPDWARAASGALEQLKRKSVYYDPPSNALPAR